MDGSGDWVRVFIDGERVQHERALGADYRRVSTGYFETMAIEAIAGRPLNRKDDGGESVAVINAEFASRFLSGRDPLGARGEVAPSMGLDPGDQLREWMIVGVVETVQEWGPTSFEIPMIYVPHTSDPHAAMSLVLRTDAPPETLVGPLREIVREIGDSPVDGVRTLASAFQGSYETHRFMLALLGVFAVLAAVLSAIGLYGVMAYHVIQRQREIGVRVALGAARRDVARMVLRQGTGMALLAVVLGVAGAIPMARALSTLAMGRLLVDMHWFDPIAFGAVPLLVMATAVLASWLPARRAARVDPVEALRAEA
jgi:putative ABC transport system permease protein